MKLLLRWQNDLQNSLQYIEDAWWLDSEEPIHTNGNINSQALGCLSWIVLQCDTPTAHTHKMK